MTLSRLRALFRQRIHYRLTLAGFLDSLAAALTGSAAFLSGNNLLFLIFTAMVALLLVSGFLSRLVLAGLELELLLPEHVSARTPTAARIRLRNLKRFTPSFSIELSGKSDPLQRTPSILPAPLYFPLIPGHGLIEVPAEVLFPRRGRHRDHLFILSPRFPFGFLRKSTTVELHRETIVFPALTPDDSLTELLDALSGEIETHLRGAGRDFYRIRPYETADNARHVDWKATAHTNSLQVREFTRDDRRTVEIFLDRRLSPAVTPSDVTAPDAPAAFEHRIDRCAWLLWTLSALDTRLCLRSQRFSLSVPEDGEIYDMLRFLALVEPLFQSANDPSEPPPDASSLHIVFTASPPDFQHSAWSSASILS